MESTNDKLDGISRALERHNEIAREMLDVMRKPENRFIGTLKTIVLIVGALGVFSTVEIARRWLAGG